MDNCLNFMDKAYKQLVEAEFLEVCDAVLEGITIRHQLRGYIPYEIFLTKANEYIKSRNLPIDISDVKKYIDNKIAKKELISLKGGSIYNKISSLISNRFFNKYTAVVKEQEKNKERTKKIDELKLFFEYYRLRQPTVYTSFKELSVVLNQIGMKETQQLTVLISTIELNFSCHTISDFSVFHPDYEALLKHKFKTISTEELCDLVIHNKLEKFIAENDNEKSEELVAFMENNSEDVTYLQNACIAIHELLKKHNLTDEDKETIQECLEKLSFPHLYHRLIKSIENVHKETENIKEGQEIPPEKKVQSIKPKIPQKKINQVYYEISRVYDLDNHKEKKLLSLDEIIYILSLMYSIEMDEKVITRFLHSTMHNYYKNDSLAILYQSYDKFASFDNPEVKEHMEMIEYILSEGNIFICNDETYEDIKTLIANELGYIISLVYDNYDYEIASAKKLLKESEEN